jgi:anti-anti-sigma factor
MSDAQAEIERLTRESVTMRRQLQLAEGFNRMVQTIAADTPDAEAHDICTILVETLAAAQVGLAVYADDQTKLRLLATQQYHGMTAAWPQLFATAALAEAVCSDGNILTIPDAGNDPRIERPQERFPELEGAVLLLVPLLQRDSRLGIIEVLFRIAREVREDEYALLHDTAGVLSLQLANRRLQTQLDRELDDLHHAEAIINAQASTLAELSTPLIPLTSTVLVLPLVGAVDSNRAQQILETLLEGVQHHNAHTAIIDITGLPIIDTHVAGALINAAQAVRLLGAEVIITGIRPEVAQTLVSIGIDLSSIITYGALQHAIEAVLRNPQASGKR